MAKPLVIDWNGKQFPLALQKVERADLYGFIETETLDEKGRKCTLATLADDGKTLVGTSGSAMVMLSPDGEWLEKKSLIPIDNQGKPVAPVVSSFSAPVPVGQTATIEEFLNHNIRSVYEISSEMDFSPLMEELRKGTIFHFPYSFRGGLEADAGFLLLAADGTPFLAIGTPTKLEFVGLEQPTGAAAEEEGAEEDEELDFSMM